MHRGLEFIGCNLNYVCFLPWDSSSLPAFVHPKKKSNHVLQDDPFDVKLVKMQLFDAQRDAAVVCTTPAAPWLQLISRSQVVNFVADAWKSLRPSSPCSFDIWNCCRWTTSYLVQWKISRNSWPRRFFRMPSDVCGMMHVILMSWLYQEKIEYVCILQFCCSDTLKT